MTTIDGLKDLLGMLGPLIGVVLGGALTGATALLKARAERKRLIASALADLLEVRFRVARSEQITKLLHEKKLAPAAAMPHLRNFFEALSPMDAGLNERYDKAITTLAGIDPVLSYALRSKNTLPNAMSSLRNVFVTHGAGLAEFEAIESMVLTVTLPELNDAVRLLGRCHSRATRKRVENVIKETDSAPAKIADLLDKVMAQFVPQPAPNGQTEAGVPALDRSSIE